MATAVDPICKMDVDTDNSPGGSSDFQGTTYYFCAPGCKVTFDGEPEKYLGQEWVGLDMSHGESESKPAFFSRLFGRK